MEMESCKQRVRGKHSSAQGITTNQGGGQCPEVAPDMLSELPPAAAKLSGATGSSNTLYACSAGPLEKLQFQVTTELSYTETVENDNV